MIDFYRLLNLHMDVIFSIALSALFSGLIGWLAFRRDSLTLSGMWGAVVVGTAIFGFGGWRWGVLLALFFISSSALSHFRKGDKAAVAAEKFAKGHARDWGQVMANGGVGAVLAASSFFWPTPYWWPFFIGVMATVNADTWATELGTLAKRPPRLILSGRIVPVGTSGGITGWGTLATLLGGLVIGLGAAVLSAETTLLMGVLLGGISGLCGSLIDSVLGATVQAMYVDPLTGIETEKAVYNGRRTKLIRGFVWMTNDMVNLLASLMGSVVAWLLLPY